MKKVFWLSLMEAIKGISIGLAGGFIVVITQSKEYTILQFVIGLLILIFLATITNYHVNCVLYKNRKEIKNIKKHL